MKQRKRIPWGQVIGTGLSLAMGVGCGVVLTSWFDRCPAGVSRPLWALGLAAFLLFLAVIGGFTAAMNGIPLRLGNIDNDGRNALSLGRAPAALRAFWVQMKVAEA